MEDREIDINIWDDFYDDGYVPEGEVTETFIYVEDGGIPVNKKKEYLEILLGYIKTNLNIEGINLWMGNSKYSGDPQIKLEGITHKRLHEWMDVLDEVKITGDGIPFNIYSES